MIELKPNTTPKGESCGTCLFASTHTIAEERKDQVVVRCRRFPPAPPAQMAPDTPLNERAAASTWTYTLWDDWCGEWEARES